MSAEPHLDQVTADAARAAAVATGLFKAVYEATERRGEQDARVDTIMVVGVFNWTHEDGTEREDIIIGSETKKQYAQRGILESAIDNLRDPPEDDEDEDD